MQYRPARSGVPFALPTVLLALTASMAHAQAVTWTGPIPFNVPQDRASEEIDALHPQIVARARALALEHPAPAQPQIARTAIGTYNFPLRTSASARGFTPWGLSNFVDLDAGTGLRDFACGSRTYNGHQGTDFFTWPFSLSRLDNNEAVVVAAAAGQLVAKQDGAADRNCVPLTTPSPPPANYATIRHDDGTYGYYYHMKNGSLTAKTIGSRIAAGERLGIVASSGRSTGPHLHFEVRDETDAVVDPFAGTCGTSPTLWKHQWNATADFKIVQVSTHDAAPQTASCNTNTNTYTATDVPSYRDSFSIGQPIYTLAAVRDYPVGGTLRFQLFAPDASLYIDETLPPGTEAYAGAYWVGSFTLTQAAPTGMYRLRIGSSTGQSMEHAFSVGPTLASTNLAAAVLPSGRSIRSNGTATVFATIVNSGTQAAEGCTIQPDTPLYADVSFQPTDPATNALIGTPNVPVRIAAGAAQTFVLSFKPNGSAVAKAATTVLRFKCTNAAAAAVYEGVNTLLLSFDPNPVPDVVPIAATASGDGVVRVPGTSGSQAWSAASVNIGAAATLTVQPQLAGTTAANVTVCETNSGTGACLATPTSTTSANFATNGVRTFAIFVQASGTIAFDPASTRIQLNFVDSAGVIRGQTSVALTTQ